MLISTSIFFYSKNNSMSVGSMWRIVFKLIIPMLGDWNIKLVMAYPYKYFVNDN